MLTILVSLLLCNLVIYKPVLAQEDQPDGPVYIVQEGDSLWQIALRFGVSVDSLANENGIADAGQLAIGDALVIPGLEGVQGYLTTQDVSFGDTLTSLSRRFQIPVEELKKLNKLTSSYELYVGRSLVVLESNQEGTGSKKESIEPGRSLFENAISNAATPWTYIIENDLSGSWNALPGDALHIPVETIQETGENQALLSQPSALPDSVKAISIDPLPGVQGKTEVIIIKAGEGIEIRGSFIDRNLAFMKLQNSEYTSIHGIHAMADPGAYPLSLQFFSNEQKSGETSFTFTQPVYITSGGYAFDPVLEVSPETIDPAVTQPEDAQWNAFFAPITSEKLWEGKFVSPAPKEFADCWPSLFGNRRSYNGSPYEYFHTGLDFCGGVGTQIFAPARGEVVFAGPLTVRGNATVINHGWGVYTAYMHQSEILVKTGDMVEPGQVIGLVGGTGRVTGPHLHWEVWAGGIQVDPIDWLNQTYPEQ